MKTDTIKKNISGQSVITRFELQGYLNNRLETNEKLWLHNALKRNPALFETFGTRDTAPRCIVPWFGEYPGKLLTGMALRYRMSGDKKTLEAGNEIVSQLKAVQGNDGYLGPHPQARRLNGLMHEDTPTVFGWENSALWDVWGHYHVIYGLYEWYAATNNYMALEIAIKAADCVCRFFVREQRPFSSASNPEMNLSLGHALALLYRETGTELYKTTAVAIVSEWEKPDCGNWYMDALAGKSFYESEKPRWEALHCVMTLAELYRITGQKSYYTALENIWKSIVRTDRHNDGGFSSDEGAVGEPYRLSAIETCCTVAWMALTTEYLKLSHLSEAADELELSFFNAALGSLTQDDIIFTYSVPMNGQRVGADTVLYWQTIDGGRDMNCCQANGSRGLSQVADWAVLSDDTGFYLNFYGPCSITALTPENRTIRLTEKTEYPLGCSVDIVLETEADEEFPMHIRIPVWSKRTELIINGEKIDGVTAGSYYTAKRCWKNGDRITLRLDMSAHYWAGGGAVSGKTSVYHGPILLALDSCVSGTDIDTCVLSREAMESMAIKGNVNGHWLLAETKDINGNTVTLSDFADCGRDGSQYISWLNIQDAPEPSDEYRDLLIWCRR